MVNTPDATLIRDEPLSHRLVTEWRHNGQYALEDVLAEETPVALIYNGVSHAVMLATAQDLEDFALGFSLSEGIVDTAQDIYGIEIRQQQQGIELHCEIATNCFVRLKERRRTLAGKTGCGLCGAESLSHAVRYPAPLPMQLRVTRTAIESGLQAIQSGQSLQKDTGATHASAFMLQDGSLAVLREDVGRHNALDKLVGALAKARQKGKPPAQGFVITTSRASFEMIQKTASAGIELLVAVSAPTALAVRVAEACGLTLVGFARKDRFVVYCHDDRILNQ